VTLHSVDDRVRSLTWLQGKHSCRNRCYRCDCIHAQRATATVHGALYLNKTLMAVGLYAAVVAMALRHRDQTAGLSVTQ